MMSMKSMKKMMKLRKITILRRKSLETIDALIEQKRRTIKGLKSRQEKLCGELRELQQERDAIQAMKILSALKKCRRCVATRY